MIEKVTITRGNVLEQQQKLMDESPYAMSRAARAIVPRERKAFFDRIGRPAPIPPSPFIWSTQSEANDRARRWYAWAVETGLIKTRNGHYLRTGKLKKSAFLDGNFGNLEGLITMGFRGTDSRGAVWVYGERQIPGHRAYPRLSTLAKKSATSQANQFAEFFKVYNETNNIGTAISASKSKALK